MFKIPKKIAFFLLLGLLPGFFLLKTALADNPPPGSPSQTITVTASVPPQVSDLPITIESLDSGTQFPQDTELSYKITYGSLTQETLELTIQAQWSQGTVEGSPVPTEDILDYVVGSASNAYGSTPAVIDTVNRTITWSITNFPSNTQDQTVTFKLKTNSSYTGSYPVGFTVSARSMSQTTVTPDQSVSQSYLFNLGLVPTPTPTPIPTPTPTPGASSSTTTTPTPTPAPATVVAPLTFQQISIRSISNSDATVSVTTSTVPSLLTISYGTLTNNLSQSITNLNPGLETLITLSNLSPDTDYYFKVLAKDQNANVVSDIFTFHTALISEVPQIDQSSLVVTSKDNILASPTLRAAALEQAKNTVVIPVSTVFAIKFSLLKYESVKNIQAIVRNKYVLGINTAEAAEPGSSYVNLVEIQSGTYVGKLTSLPEPGYYEIFVRITDFNGNIAEQKLADLKVVDEIKILESGTNKPIENARLLLYLYNRTQKTYALIPPQVLPINNPVFPEPDGTVPIVLPQAQYKAEIMALGYQSKVVEFTVGYSKDQNLPVIYLQKEPFNILTTVKYYYTTFMDFANASQDYLTGLSNSIRLFNLISLIVGFALVGLTFLFFSIRTRTGILSIFSYLIFKLKKYSLGKSGYIAGKIVEETTQKPVVGANVYIIDGKNNKIIYHTKTNQIGEFFYKNSEASQYKISVMKKGFVPNPFFELDEQFDLSNLSLSIEKDETPERRFAKELVWVSEGFVEFWFGFLLLASFVFEFCFTSTFGVKVIPLITISLINLILWISFRLSEIKQ